MNANGWKTANIFEYFSNFEIKDNKALVIGHKSTKNFRHEKNEKLYSGSFVLLMMLGRTCSSCLLMVRRLEVGPGLEITKLPLLGKGDQEWEKYEE